MSDTYAVRGGLYTNMASSADLVVGAETQSDQIQMYGLSTSFVRFTRTTSMSFGLNYSFGKGDAQPVKNDDIVNLKRNSIAFFFSGAYTF